LDSNKSNPQGRSHSYCRNGGILRRFGFRRVLVVNGLIAAAGIVGCALITPDLPLLLRGLILMLAGASRSMQFTAITMILVRPTISKEKSMRFSLVAGPRQRPDLGQSAADAWWNYVEDAVLAEKLGFDSVFVGEHHFCFASGTSSPFVMLAQIAARTERVRVGTSITCLPFHNPLRVAEDIAAVDIASRGRFDFGVGVGSQFEEFETFGINSGERFGRTWEGIDIIERCLHGGEEVFSHKGKYFDFPNVRWIIPPYQKRIPFFWGGFGEQGVKRAAERGYHLIAPDFSGVYSRTMREHGRNPEDYLIGFSNPVSIAGNREEAFQAVAEPTLWVSNIYATRRNLDGSWPPESARISMERFRAGWEKGEPVGMFSPIAGTVDDVIARMLPIVQGLMGITTHIGIEARAPGTKTEDVRRTMTLFAQEVMPVLKAEAAKRSGVGGKK
jgi:alkanesulfonate monooxygenase SsuD/methylene tetrahydromethanopterin reductase-like flavin-dependent oxidoreductase (luciferase family)